MNSFFSLIVALALPYFSYAADTFDFEWTLKGPAGCAKKDMDMIYDRLELALEVYGTTYLQENGYNGAKISNVKLSLDYLDRRLNNGEMLVSEHEQEHRNLPGGSGGTGSGECSACPGDDDDRRELMGRAANSLLGKMMHAVDEDLPEFLYDEIKSNGSKGCKANARAWSAEFMI